MISVIIDIGSGSVGIALVLLEKGKVPVIKYSARKVLHIERKLNLKRLLQQSLDSLITVITEMQKKMVEVPSGIFCFLSPHLIASQTRIVNVDLKKPTKIDDALIIGIIDKELLQFGDKAIVEQKIMRVKLNGYEVSNFENKIANEAEVSVFFTTTSWPILDDIRNVIKDSFHNEQIEFHSFPFAYFNVLRDIFKTDSDFVFVDVGSEITDVSLVKDNILTRSLSFPLGKSHVIRRIVDRTMSNEHIAKSIIKNYTEEAVVNHEVSDIHNNISIAAVGWAQTMETILNDMGKEEQLPNKMYILADKDVSGVFKKNIGRDLDIKELSNVDFNKFCNNRSGTIDDPFLMIATIFINKLLN